MLRILAVDDERIGLAALMGAIKQVNGESELYGFRTAGEALELAGKVKLDVAFLDINLRGKTNGVELAEAIKKIHPRINIVFCTGYDEYQQEAFGMRASGYILKPVTVEKIRAELENLRYGTAESTHENGKNVLEIRTFGNFEVFADGLPMKFKYEKTKELLAYLVDRKGAFCSNGEIAVALWEDEDHESYLRGMKKDLVDHLKAINQEEAVVVQRGRIAIVPSAVNCDYYRYLDGDDSVIKQYRGEYMNQYSWAEITNGSLLSLLDDF